jgi:hypothetical protein
MERGHMGVQITYLFSLRIFAAITLTQLNFIQQKFLLFLYGICSNLDMTSSDESPQIIWINEEG